MEKPRRKHPLKFSKHANERRKERFGKKLDVYDQRWIAQQIHEGKTVYLRRYSNERTAHAIRMSGKWMVVIWNKKAQMIMTVREPRIGELEYFDPPN